MSKVCIVKCLNYDTANVERAVSAALTEIDAKRLFKSDERILLKPNLLSAKPSDMGVTTHPQVIRAVAKELLEYGVNLSYGDSPALDSTEKAVRISGIQAVMDELEIPAADFRNTFIKDYPAGEFAHKFHFVQAVHDNDGIVNIPKFKTHALTKFTGSLKNLFGLVPGFLKAKDHVRFPDELRFTQMLADMNKCLAPRLHIMDAVIGMEGNGPANGTPRQLSMIIASADPVALDSVCVTIMGLDYSTVPVITTASSKGLGIADITQIDLSLITDLATEVRRGKASEILPELVINDFQNAVNGHPAINMLNTRIGLFLKRVAVNRPTVIDEKCTRCKVCVKVCPVVPKAITFSKDKNSIEYSYDKCIRCFCCQEVCPYGAIKIIKAPLNFLLWKPYEKRNKGGK